MDSSITTELYNASYYANHCGRPYQRDEVWLGFFYSVADNLIKSIQPVSVLDAGCAWGFLVEGLRQRGVQAFGIDISEYAIQNVHPDIKPFCWVGSVAESLPRHYDLIVCLEVLEHMPQEEAKKAIENYCQFTDDVLFSSTPYDFKEVTHVNVQPIEYWAELFAQQGFFRDTDFDASFLTPWAVRFRRKNDPPARIIREYERKFFQLWRENLELRSQNFENRDLASNLNHKTQEVSALNQEVKALNHQLEVIRQSRSWRLIQELVIVREKLIPYGSAREQLLQKFHLLSKKA